MSSTLVSRTIAVLVLSGVAGIAMLPLAETDWAETARVDHTLPSEAEPTTSNRGRPPKVAMLILPFVKVSVLMGVPASLVLGIAAIARRRRRR